MKETERMTKLATRERDLKNKSHNSSLRNKLRIGKYESDKREEKKKDGKKRRNFNARIPPIQNTKVTQDRGLLLKWL